MRGARRHGSTLLLLYALLNTTACSLPALLEENAQTVRASTSGIAENTRNVQQSTAVTRELLPAMEGLRTLERPMTEVAALGPPMSRVAALDTPMRNVAALSTDMQAVARLADPMNRVASMRTSLDAVSALNTPMQQVAALRPELIAVGELQGSMRDLAALREPMTRVAELKEPMARLASVAAMANPLGIVLLAAVGLVLWAAVTFFAVRLAVVSALQKSNAATLPPSPLEEST